MQHQLIFVLTGILLAIVFSLSLFNLKYLFIIVTISLNGYLVKYLINILLNSKEYQNKIFKNDKIFQIFIGKWFSSPNKVNEAKIKLVLSQFIDRFSIKFIESWYYSSISKNNEFLIEAKFQLNYLFMDLFKRVASLDKLKLLREITFEFNSNFINFIKHPNSINREMLHPVLENSPDNEIDYIIEIVRIILNKSSIKESNLNDKLVESILYDIIGKNCLAKLVDLMSQPSFLFYCLILLTDKNFSAEKYAESAKQQINFESSNKEDEIDSFIDNHEKSETISLKSIDTESYHRSTFISQNSSSDLNSISTFDIISNTDNPIQIKSLKITKTHTDYDSKNGEPYTLYEIHCIYINDDSLESKSKKIRRRFSEFVLFQKRLEANLTLRPLIRNIKGPTSAFSLPIGNMDEQYIKKRKEKLNKYLDSLVNIEQVSQCDELYEFLGFKSETLVKRNSQDNQNLFKIFNDIIEKINPLKKLDKKTKEDLKQSSSVSNMFDYLDSGKLTINYEYSKACSNEFISKLDFYLKNHHHKNFNLTYEVLSKQESSHKSEILFKVPTFSQTLYDLIVKLISNSSSNHNQHFLANKSFKLFIGDFIGEFYAEKLFKIIFDNLFSDEKLLVYVKMLEDTLFNENNESKMDLLRNKDLSAIAKESILRRIPNLLKLIIGYDIIDDAIQVLLDSLKSPLLNRHFSYCIIDILMDNLYQNEL